MLIGFHRAALVAVGCIQPGRHHRVVVASLAKCELAVGRHDDAHGIVNVEPVAVHVSEGSAIELFMSIGSVECAFGLRQLVDADGHQSALLGSDGGRLIRAYIIYIYNGIARRRVDGEAVVERSVVGVQLAVHHVAVAAQVVDAADDGCGIGSLALYLVPTEEVTRVVGTEGHDDLVLVYRVGSNIARIAAQSLAPREAGEARVGGSTDDVLRRQNLRSTILAIEIAPRGGGEVSGGEHFVHEPRHHHAVGLDTHAAGTHVGTQQPRAVGGGGLAGLDHLVGQVLQHQRMRVAQEAGVGRVGGNLVVEEEAPVVAVGHGQLAVGQCQPVEHLLHHLVVVVHQGVGLPFLLAVESLLEQLQGQCSLAQFLNDHVLIAGVEVVVVLQRIVIVEVLALIEVFHGLLVVVGVDDGIVWWHRPSANSC